MNRCDECKHRHDCVCVPYGCESFEIDIAEYEKQIYNKGYNDGVARQRLNCDDCFYKLSMESGEYEKKIRAEILKEVEQAMYHQAFNIDHEDDGLQKWDSGNWIRYKLFEKVMKQLKEQKNDKC